MPVGGGGAQNSVPNGRRRASAKIICQMTTATTPHRCCLGQMSVDSTNLSTAYGGLRPHFNETIWSSIPCPWIVQLYLQLTAAYDRSFMKQSGQLYVIQYDVVYRHNKVRALRLTTAIYGVIPLRIYIYIQQVVIVVVVAVVAIVATIVVVVVVSS